MKPFKQSIPIYTSLKNNPLLDSTDGIYGKTGVVGGLPGQSALIPSIDNNTSPANAVDAIVTYLEDNNTKNIIGVMTVTKTPLSSITLGIETVITNLTYSNGPNNDGIGAQLVSPQIVNNIGGLDLTTTPPLALNQRILITSEGLAGIPIVDSRDLTVMANNDICNGVYDIVNLAPFVARRSVDSDYLSIYNNTSFIVLKGADAGKLYSVSFDPAVNTRAYFIGFEPIVFESINLGGSSGVVGDPTVPPLGSIVNNVINAAGINTTDTVADAFDKIIFNVDNLSTQLLPLPLFDEYVSNALTQTESLFITPDQSYSVVLNSSLASATSVSSNIWQVAPENAYIGATNLQFILTNYAKNGTDLVKIFNINTNNNSTHPVYPTIGPIRKNIAGNAGTNDTLNIETSGPLGIIGTAAINLTTSLPVNTTTRFNLNGTLNPAGPIRFYERGYLANSTNNTPESKTRQYSLDVNFTKSVLFPELPNNVEANPNVNNYKVRIDSTLNSSTPALEFSSKFYTYGGARAAPVVNLFDVRNDTAIPAQYISGVPRMRSGETLPITFVLRNVIDRYLIPGPFNAEIESNLSTLNKLNYKVPANALFDKYNLDTKPDSRIKKLSEVLDHLDVVSSNVLQQNMKDVKINVGHIFEAYYYFNGVNAVTEANIITNHSYFNTDILDNADARFANVLSGGKANPAEIFTFPNDLTFTPNQLKATHSSGLELNLETKVGTAKAIVLPGQLNITCKATRWDNVSTNTVIFSPDIIIDTISHQNTIITPGDKEYGALFISETDTTKHIIRVEGSDTNIDSDPSSVLGLVVTSTNYNSQVSIHHTAPNLPYNRDLLLMGGIYQYPNGDYSASYPFTTNDTNFVLPVANYKRYATFLIRKNNPENVHFCFKDVSSLIIEIVNSNIHKTGVDTRNSTLLEGNNGLVSNQDFEMYIMFVSDSVTNHTCRRSRGAIIDNITDTLIWLNANKYYNGFVGPDKGCVDESYENTPNKKRLTFGLNRFSGDLLIRVGMSQFTGFQFTGINVTVE